MKILRNCLGSGLPEVHKGQSLVLHMVWTSAKTWLPLQRLPRLKLCSSKSIQMCTDGLVWAGRCSSVGWVRCVPACGPGTCTTIVTSLCGGLLPGHPFSWDIVKWPKLAYCGAFRELLFAFSSLLFPLSPAASFLSVTFPCREQSRTKSAFSFVCSYCL